MSNEPTREEPPDATAILVAEVGAGQFERFNELFDRVAPAVRAWASLRMPAPLSRIACPEDIVQEVWMRAIRKVQDFDVSRGAFRPWLFGIARMVIMEAMRDAKKTRYIPNSDQTGCFSLSQVPIEATTISGRVARDEQLTIAIGVLGELPDEDRELLIWRGLEAREYEEIAEALKLSEAAVRKRWQRLRERLALDESCAGLLEV